MPGSNWSNQSNPGCSRSTGHTPSPPPGGTASRRSAILYRGVAPSGAQLARPACPPTEGAGRGGRQAVWPHVIDGLSQNPQDVGGSSLGGIERAEQVGEFCQCDRRMIHDPGLEQPVDPARRLALENIDIDACIEKQLAADQMSTGDEGKVRVLPAYQRCCASLRLDPPN